LMLRDLLGNESFDRALRLFWSQNKFRVASWSDLQNSFETESGKKLKTFFEQWLTYTGAPSVRIAKAVRTHSESGYHVTVTLEQEASSYSLRVPIAVHDEEDVKIKIFNMDKESQTFSFESRAKPIKVTLDPDFRLFRRLAPDESPPILRQIMVDHSTETILLSEKGDARDVSQELAGKLLHRTPKIASLADTGKVTSILVIGLQDQVNKWLDLNKLPPRPLNMRRDGTAYAWAIRQDGVTFVVVSAKDAPSLQSLVRPLPHYGRQSYIVFDGAKAMERGTWPARVQGIMLN
jgi:aminopeptidase N